MRRIMIARRNNVKDHAVLKKVRATEAMSRGATPGQKREKSSVKVKEGEVVMGGDESQMQMSAIAIAPVRERSPSPSNPSGTKRRRKAGVLQPSDEDILMEMDVPAVEATRSYRKWLSLAAGKNFRYNQTYTKGKDDHDWLLKKNIWRRMRYRRENRVKLEQMQSEGFIGTSTRDVSGDWPTWKTEMMTTNANVAAAGVDSKAEEDALVSRAVVGAAAAAAAQVDEFEPGIDADAVAALGAEDPIVSSALDAAAQIAASAVAHLPPNMPPPINASVEDNILGDGGVEAVEVLIQV